MILLNLISFVLEVKGMIPKIYKGIRDVIRSYRTRKTVPLPVQLLVSPKTDMENSTRNSIPMRKLSPMSIDSTEKLNLIAQDIEFITLNGTQDKIQLDSKDNSLNIKSLDILKKRVNKKKAY